MDKPMGYIAAVLDYPSMDTVEELGFLTAEAARAYAREWLEAGAFVRVSRVESWRISSSLYQGSDGILRLGFLGE
jgi:hypothetical protein